MKWIHPSSLLAGPPEHVAPARKHGQSLIEFAFAVIPFFLISFGTIEFGWAVYSYNTINNAADEGARRGMVLNRPGNQYGFTGNDTGTHTNPSCNPSTIVGTVGCNLGLLPASQVRVILDVPTPTGANSNIIGYNLVSVEVQYDYQPIIVYPVKSSFTMFAKSQTITQ